ncbi:hypothetical protein Nos7524_2401 [Nostoc sp. PCC 7524]|nr:hypothetical protein Nos7524_2401 [Nostoc sp. PCC 7524]
MKVDYKQIQKWIVQPVLIGVVTVGAIAYQAEVSFASHGAIAASKSTPKPVSQNQAIYRSDRFRFQFSYSVQDFAIDNQLSTPRNNVNSPLATIDIWTKNHAQKIRAGEYEGGTEYPANVHITINNNPRKLSLQNWVKQSNQFSATRNFQSARMAGQRGIKFQSSGLYENEHVAFVSPRDSRIIVLTLSKTGYGNNDAIYRQAYQQVINSFAFFNR